MTTATVNYRRERLRRGWLDLFQHAEGEAWGFVWNPDFGEPDWPGHTYSAEDDDLPADYPDKTDAEALVEWVRKHSAPWGSGRADNMSACASSPQTVRGLATRTAVCGTAGLAHLPGGWCDSSRADARRLPARPVRGRA